jgi:tryptophanyl-tRNA synthetase
LLSDKPEQAAKKIMAAETDSLGMIKLDWEKQPGISNLLQISALLSKKSLAEVEKVWSAKTSYGELKSHVAEQVKEFLTNLQTGLARIDEAKLLKKLEEDEKAMSQVANNTLLRVQKAVGLRA